MNKKEAADFGKLIGITIRWSAEWSEFQVYPKGTGKDDPRSYFTGDIEDAVATAIGMSDVVTTEGMNDAQRIIAWSHVYNLKDAAIEMLKHREYLDPDPYYRDVDGALWAMLERSLKNANE